MKNLKKQEHKNQEQILKDADTLRTCTVCGDYMISGYIDEGMTVKYYCKNTCLNKGMTEKEKQEAYEADELYYTEWHDTEIFVVFDNQYATLEDAQYIKENHGNNFTKIEVKTINLDLPVFKIIDGEQIEIEELCFKSNKNI